MGSELGMGTRWLAFAALGFVILGNALGNLLLKLGANTPPGRPLLLGLVPWQTVAGIAFFASGILAYAWALKHIHLHEAQVVVSLQYVLAILLAALVLGENIAPGKWLGMGMIALGLWLCMRQSGAA